MTTVVGVDGCPDGWLAVEYTDSTFEQADRFEGIEPLWDCYSEAETILIDVPIGLRENSNKPRPCDAAARDRLGSPRSSSVFPTPVRETLTAESYEEAREIQERRTGGSIGSQTWGLASKIEEVDVFLRDEDRSAVGCLREAHPEVCFWGLNNESATTYSKTGRPIAAVSNESKSSKLLTREFAKTFERLVAILRRRAGSTIYSMRLF